MKTIKKMKIAWIILAALLVLPNDGLAEGEWTQTGNHIYSTNTGYVGIGTTNPTEKLTISNGNLELKGSEGLTALKLIDGGTGDPGYAQFLYNGAVVIQVGAGNGGTYFNFGNVGIGTTNPKTALDVAGIIRANGRIQVNTNDIGFLATIDNPIAPPDTAQTLISTLKKNTLEKGDHNQLRLGFYANDDGGGSPDKRFFTSIEAVVENPNNSTRMAGLRFLTNKAGAELERMRINGNGNIGIGTASPVTALHIDKINPAIRLEESNVRTWDIALDNSPDSLQFRDRTSNTVPLTISGTGNIGVGTTSPGSKLNIYGTGHSAIVKIESDAASYPYLQLYKGANLAQFYNTGTRLAFQVGGGDEDMVILNNGSVGIGTTSPESKLAVNGTITAKEIKVKSGWSDFVFEPGYDLASLNEVESFIRDNKHLPDIPSAKEVEEKGLEVSEMLAKQMQKIEEMTLYLIELKKENDHLKATVENQNRQLSELKELRERIETLELKN